MTWDEIAPRLGRIETYSTAVVRDAENVARNVRELATIPGFETRAGASLHNARERLTAALAQIDTAISEFGNKRAA